jgi:hypothetical protein
MEKVARLQLDNIFNTDETGLFFRMAPNQTLASAPIPGTKLVSKLINFLTKLQNFIVYYLFN